MTSRLRVRIVPGRQHCCRTHDGYVLFACAWRHARVAIIRPGSQVPFVYLRSMLDAAATVEADRSARAESL